MQMVNNSQGHLGEEQSEGFSWLGFEFIENYNNSKFKKRYLGKERQTHWQTGERIQNRRTHIWTLAFDQDDFSEHWASGLSINSKESNVHPCAAKVKLESHLMLCTKKSTPSGF